jgi:hypothetical protein
MDLQRDIISINVNFPQDVTTMICIRSSRVHMYIDRLTGDSEHATVVVSIPAPPTQWNLRGGR